MMNSKSSYPPQSAKLAFILLRIFDMDLPLREGRVRHHLDVDADTRGITEIVRDLLSGSIPVTYSLDGTDLYLRIDQNQTGELRLSLAGEIGRFPQSIQMIQQIFQEEGVSIT